MHYWIAANLLVIFHLGFICFVVVGGLLAARWQWVAWLHLPAVLWGVLIEYQGWVCPLTPLEQQLRRAAGHAGYSGGFVEHYVLPLIYPGFLGYELQLRLALLVVLVNLAVYGWLITRRVRANRSAGR